MTLNGMASVRRAARSIRNRVSPRVLCLQYHRVVDLQSDPYLLSVTPQHFDEHLSIVKKYGCPMGLRQVANALCGRNLPYRAIVITFDDGYDDCLHTAKPLLERYEIPATVFVVTGQIGHTREFWWDELDRLLLQPRSLPQTLRLRLNGHLYEWELGETKNHDRGDVRCNPAWNFARADDPTSRHRLFRSLYQLLQSLSTSQKWGVLDELLMWSAAGATVRSTHQTLSREGVVRLVAGGLVEVGAHTVTHPVLSNLPLSTQRDEIVESKMRLEEILGKPVDSFSYPHGLKSHYTAETVAAVRDAGFVCACSSFGGAVRQSVDRYQLPRIVVRDWDGDAFESHIRKWLRD